MNNMKFGLIGASIRGLWLIKLATEASGGRLVAVTDPSEQAHANARHAFGDELASYKTVRSMLDAHHDLSAIFIASPDMAHYENVMDALTAKVPIYVEKPLAQHVEHCDAILTAWQKSPVVFCGGLELRHATLAETMHELIDSEIIGEPAYITCTEYVPSLGMHVHPLYRKKSTGRSLLLQKGVHDLDLMNGFAGGSPVWTSAVAGQSFTGGDRPSGSLVQDCPDCQALGLRPRTAGVFRELNNLPIPATPQYCVHGKDVDMEDNYQMLVRYDNGVRGVFTLCYNAPEYSHEFAVVGIKGNIRAFYDHKQSTFRFHVRENRTPDRETVIQPPFRPGSHGGGDPRIIDHFLACVREGRQPLADIQAARNSAALAAAAQDSIECGAPVEIPIADTNGCDLSIEKQNTAL